MLRTCNVCKIEQSLEDFPKDKTRPLGRKTVCAKCCYATNKVSREKNRDKVLKRKRVYYERVKNTPEYKAKVKDYQNKNKETKRQYDKEYRARTAEKQKEWSDNWAANNPEKVRASKHNYKVKRRAIEKDGIPHGELTAWIKAQDKVCYWCGDKCLDNFHVDHYEPLSRGGKHEIDNLVVACDTCNLRKNCRDPYEFAQTNIGRLF